MSVWGEIKTAAAWFGPHRTFWVLAWACTMIGSCIGGFRMAPIPEPWPDVGDGEVHAYGWIDADELAEPIRRRNRWPLFADTPAGKAIRGEEPPTVALWKAVEQASGGRYEHCNQGQVGCCVGCGTKHAADATQAVEIVVGKQAERWVPLSAEALYATSRVEVGKGQIIGDGSLGAWAAEAATKYGFAPMDVVGAVDLRTFDPARAREWGRWGVPRPVKEEMAKHKMGSAAKVTTWAEAKKALAQGYAVFVCSNVGFESRKDRDGFLAPRGTWPHCMAILGYQTARDGGLIVNSWGPTAHPGPRGWGDPPEGSFWADAQTIDRMLRQGDSYALSRFDGFPAREIDWWADGRPKAGWPVWVRRQPEIYVLAR